jgi:ketosteroid isomerase-like protein
MSEVTRTARDVVDEALRLLLAEDVSGFADLWAVDGVLEFPFAATGYPQRLEGREAVREYMRGYPDLVTPRAVVAKTVHDTAEPGVVVVELELEGTVVSTGLPYRMRYIAVITTRDGEILRYRDYWSPQAAAEAMGSLDVLTASTTGPVA